MSESLTAKFLEGTAAACCGATLQEIVEWDDDLLETRYNYIQWLFPLDEPSRAVPDSPVLTPSETKEIRGSQAAQIGLLNALDRMLRFYGGELWMEPGKKCTSWCWCVKFADDFDSRRHWRQPRNHNHLRLTRIMKSLTLLGNLGAAEAVYDWLCRVANRCPDCFTPETLRFWNQAGEAARTQGKG